MRYIDGFLIPIPKKNMKAYVKLAKACSKVWRDHGALEYRECAAEDMDTKFGVPFPKLAKAKKGETIVFAWIVYKSRAHRDSVNAKVMKDPRIAAMCNPKKMPFDCKRLSHGGFDVLVEA